MSQLSSNYAHKELQRVIHTTKDRSAPPAIRIRQTFEALKYRLSETGVSAKIVGICVAGVLTGTLMAHVGAELKKSDKPIVTRTVASQAGGHIDTTFDGEIRQSIDKINQNISEASATLDAHPKIERAFKHELKVTSLSPEEKALYHQVEKLLTRSKSQISNIHTRIDEKTALTVIDGKTNFMLADDIAERLENVESAYQSTIERVSSDQEKQYGNDLSL